MYESDVMYLINTFYEDDNGVVRQNSTARSILYKATAQGKTVYATDMYGNWGVYNPVDSTWVSVPTPHISAKPLVYSHGVKTNVPLNELLNTNTNYVPMNGDDGLSELMDKPFTLSSQIATLSQVFNEDYYDTSLLNRLSQLNPEVTIELVSDISRLDKMQQAQVRYGGMYYPDENKVIINTNPDEWQGSLLELINHELTHSVTADVIGFDGESKLTDEQRKIAEGIQDDLLDFLVTAEMSDYVRDRLNYAHGTSYPHELVAVVNSEGDVRRELNQLNKNLLKQVDAFTKSLIEDKFNEQHQQSTDTTQQQVSNAGDLQASTSADTAEVQTTPQSNTTGSDNQGNQSDSETFVGGGQTAQSESIRRTKGFKDLEIEQQEQSKSGITKVKDTDGLEFSFPTKLIDKVHNLQDVLTEVRMLDSGEYQNSEMGAVWDGMFDLAEKVGLNAALITIYQDAELESNVHRVFGSEMKMFAIDKHKHIVLTLHSPHNMDYRSKEMVAHEITHLLVPFIKEENYDRLNFIRQEIRKATPDIIKGSPLDYMLSGSRPDMDWNEMFTMGLTYPDVRYHIQTITMSDGQNALEALQQVFDDQVNATMKHSDYYRKPVYDLYRHTQLHPRAKSTVGETKRATQSNGKSQRRGIQARTYQEFEGLRRAREGVGDNSRGDNSSQGKIFSIVDVKKAVAARNKSAPVKALFNAYMGVVEKRYPDLSLTFTTGVDYMAKYHNNQITINKDVWDNPDIRPNKFNGLYHSHKCWVCCLSSTYHTAFKLFEGGTGKDDGKTNPTHNQSYSARTDVGVSNENSVTNTATNDNGDDGIPNATKTTLDLSPVVLIMKIRRIGVTNGIKNRLAILV